MSVADDYIKRIKELANDLFPNIAQGKRPILSKVNDLINSSQILDGPIVNNIKNRPGPIRQLLQQRFFLGEAFKNIGTRVSNLQNTLDKLVPPSTPQPSQELQQEVTPQPQEVQPQSPIPPQPPTPPPQPMLQQELGQQNPVQNKRKAQII